jgi:hypothetical protein
MITIATYIPNYDDIIIVIAIFGDIYTRNGTFPAWQSIVAVI